MTEFLVRVAVGVAQDALEAARSAMGVANLNVNELLGQGYMISMMQVDTQTLFYPDAVPGYSFRWTHVITQSIMVSKPK